MWIQTIKAHEENVKIRGCGDIASHLKNHISGPKPKWSKLTIQDLREFLSILSSECDEANSIEKFLEKYAELKVKLNAKNGSKDTIFHYPCFHGQSNVANLLMIRHADLKIDLNSRNKNWT